MRPLQDLFPQADYPDLLVGLGKPDDAAVWRLDQTQSLVVTTDFFTPVVDSPYAYGAIAAANALSDLYAMGAKPLFALNIAAMPANLPPEVIREIMMGGAEKVRQAGAVIAGGHTIQDDEPKYGLVAIGIAQTNQLITKANLQPDDVLLLTKPLGMGVTTTALKNGACLPSDESQAIEWMSQLNQQAAELALELEIKAGTDVTGFGFLGHALELATASEVGIEFWLSSIPFLQGALNYAKGGHFPGGSAENSRFYGERVTFSDELDDYQRMLLFDAQTSGGLLLGLPAERAEQYLQRAQEVGQAVWVVGQGFQGEGIKVETEAPEDRSFPTITLDDLVFLA